VRFVQRSSTYGANKRICIALHSWLLSRLGDREAIPRKAGGKAPRCEIHSTILKRPSLDEDIDISLGDQAAKPDGIGGFSLEFMAVI
jgi:hypothetical protein